MLVNEEGDSGHGRGVSRRTFLISMLAFLLLGVTLGVLLSPNSVLNSIQMGESLGGTSVIVGNGTGNAKDDSSQPQPQPHHERRTEPSTEEPRTGPPFQVSHHHDMHSDVVAYEALHAAGLHLPGCGDGEVSSEDGEECDDGNIVNGDGCSMFCQLEGNRRYLHNRPGASDPRTDLDITAYNEDVALLHKMLFERQNPSPDKCEELDVLVSTGYDYCGWGCYLHVYAQGLANAFYFNRTFIQVPVSSRVIPFSGVPMIYAGEACGYQKGTWECYYEALSRTCNDKNIGAPKEGDGLRYIAPFKPEKLEDNGRIVRHDMKYLLRDVIPWQFRHRSLLWYRAQIIRYLLRPRQWVSHEVVNSRKKLSMPRLTIGLHVRRSDKGKESPLLAEDRYYREIDAWYNITKSKNMFISTEDNATLTRFMTQYPDWKVYYTDNDRPNEILTYGTEQHFNATEQALIAIKNLALLADCDYVVATYSSNYGRLLLEIRYARLAGYTAAKSLDAPWHIQP